MRICPLQPVPQYLQKNILNAFLTDVYKRQAERLFRLMDIDGICHSAFCGRLEARFPGRAILYTTCPGLGPVSYTHLDVYKRQVL